MRNRYRLFIRVVRVSTRSQTLRKKDSTRKDYTCHRCMIVSSRIVHNSPRRNQSTAELRQDNARAWIYGKTLHWMIMLQVDMSQDRVNANHGVSAVLQLRHWHGHSKDGWGYDVVFDNSAGLLSRSRASQTSLCSLQLHFRGNIWCCSFSHHPLSFFKLSDSRSDSESSKWPVHQEQHKSTRDHGYAGTNQSVYAELHDYSEFLLLDYE